MAWVPFDLHSLQQYNSKRYIDLKKTAILRALYYWEVDFKYKKRTNISNNFGTAHWENFENSQIGPMWNEGSIGPICPVWGALLSIF